MDIAKKQDPSPKKPTPLVIVFFVQRLFFLSDKTALCFIAKFRMEYLNLECALIEQCEALELSNADLTPKVIGFLKYSAEKKCVQAQINYAFLLFFGKRVEQDKARALEFLLEAAEKKSMFAAYVIAWHYIDTDQELAFKHMLVAAQHGHPRALIHCAGMYLKGTGVERSVVNARAMLWLAAISDGIAGMFKLAELLKKGDIVDKQHAMKWFQRALDLGHPYAGLKIAEMIMSGNGVEKNVEKALDLHRKLLKERKCIISLRILAQCLCLGEGCKKDLKAAFVLYKQGADDFKDPTCMMCVAYAHQNGYGTCVNLVEAVEYYAKAAKRGVLDAMFELGEMYRDEKYGIVNYKLAIDWFCASAKEGHADSKRAMGDLHRDGLGVPKSESMSQRWYNTI
jgi:TPR repeat protein